MAKAAAQPNLAAAARRAKVAEAAAELREIENALADVIARAPALLGKVQAIRERIEKVVGAPEEE